MRILHVIEGIQESCGISRFVIEVSRKLRALNEDVAIVTTKNWNVPADDLNIFQTNSPSAVADAYKPDVVHIHGCWNMYVHCMAKWCRKHNLPYVFSPHGAWTQWAWRYHRLKKWVAWHLYQRRDALGASAFHVTVHSEADDVKHLGFPHPIHVIPLGVSMSMEDNTIFDVVQRARIVLYLGRIHPVKNLHGLLEAWRQIPVEMHSKWQLIIAGKPSPGQDNYLAKLKANAPQNVSFVGEVMGKAKERLFQDARCFVLPSFSENFGSVVLEALVNGTPVITTSGTPWDDTIKYGCGWRTEADVTSMRDAILNAMMISDDKLAQMSMAARQYVRDNYSWERSAKNLLVTYQSIISACQSR